MGFKTMSRLKACAVTLDFYLFVELSTAQR